MRYHSNPYVWLMYGLLVPSIGGYIIEYIVETWFPRYYTIFSDPVVGGILIFAIEAHIWMFYVIFKTHYKRNHHAR